LYKRIKEVHNKSKEILWNEHVHLVTDIDCESTFCSSGRRELPLILSLGNYVYRKIISLPPDERPKHRPMIKAEESRNVTLASYPELKPLLPPPSIMPTNKGWKQGWLKNLVNKFRVGSKHATKGDWTLDDRRH
jgi:hypothetical protein